MLADTLPAFHSNLTAISGTGLANTVEGAITFYTTPEAEAALGFPIALSPDEIAATDGLDKTEAELGKGRLVEDQPQGVALRAGYL